MPHEKWSPQAGDAEHTPVPGSDAASVVHDVGRHCSVMHPVCKDCHPPEFQSYLDAMHAFWKGDGGCIAARGVEPQSGDTEGHLGRIGGTAA